MLKSLLLVWFCQSVIISCESITSNDVSSDDLDEIIRDQTENDDQEETFSNEKITGDIYEYEFHSVENDVDVDEFGKQKYKRHQLLNLGYVFYSDFPDPYEILEIDLNSVKKIIRKRPSESDVETHIIYKEDKYGRIRMDTWRQKRAESGNIALEYEQDFEVHLELVSHRSQLEEYLSKQVTQKNGFQINTDEKIFTDEEKEADLLYIKSLEHISNGGLSTSRNGFEFLKAAAILKHVKAREILLFEYIFGLNTEQDINKAKSYAEELSLEGSSRGHTFLGFLYSSSVGVNTNHAKTLLHYSFGALGKDPLAQMALGYRYWTGLGVEASCETALFYYNQVATIVAQSKSSIKKYHTQKFRLMDEEESPSNLFDIMDEDLLRYYQFLADKGDVHAEVIMGKLYYKGERGIKMNYERAFNYFLNAAQSGNTVAMAYLGKMYAEGSAVVEKDDDVAFHFFKKAADLDNPIGQAGLGCMYMHGKAVAQNFTKAAQYFLLAADQGWGEGQLQLGIMYYTGSGVEINHKWALYYFKLASKSGHILAEYNLASMYASGTGTSRKCHTAVELFKKVAEKGKWSELLVDAREYYKNNEVDKALLIYLLLADLGYEVAQSNVAHILDKGQSTFYEQDEIYPKAFINWNRAAHQGYVNARLKIGDYHYYGYGTDVDYETAAIHYRVASEQKQSAQAMFNLGYMHEHGLGVKQDLNLAKRYYDMSSQTSLEAQAPVFLALMKLDMNFKLNNLFSSFSNWSQLLLDLTDEKIYISLDCNIYMISIMIIICVCFIYIYNYL